MASQLNQQNPTHLETVFKVRLLCCFFAISSAGSPVRFCQALYASALPEIISLITFIHVEDLLV
jgi:hypothetical protein